VNPSAAAIRIGIVVAFVIGLELICRLGYVQPISLVPPSAMVVRLAELMQRGRRGGENLVSHADVILHLDPLPVLGELLVAALLREWRVAVDAVLREQGAEHRRVLCFPRRLVTLHELFDIHLPLSVPG
jgi:hypothetical protein